MSAATPAIVAELAREASAATRRLAELRDEADAVAAVRLELLRQMRDAGATLAEVASAGSMSKARAGQLLG